MLRTCLLILLLASTLSLCVKLTASDVYDNKSLSHHNVDSVTCHQHGVDACNGDVAQRGSDVPSTSAMVVHVGSDFDLANAISIKRFADGRIQKHMIFKGLQIVRTTLPDCSVKTVIHRQREKQEYMIDREGFIHTQLMQHNHQKPSTKSKLIISQTKYYTPPQCSDDVTQKSVSGVWRFEQPIVEPVGDVQIHDILMTEIGQTLELTECQQSIYPMVYQLADGAGKYVHHSESVTSTLHMDTATGTMLFSVSQNNKILNQGFLHYVGDSAIHERKPVSGCQGLLNVAK